MADITKIEAYVVTVDMEHGSTDGRVFLGVAGREFALSSRGDDFEVDSHFTYILGADANVLNQDWNDPRSPQLDSSDLAEFPVYVRHQGNPYEGGEGDEGDPAAWGVDRVIVTVHHGETTSVYDNLRLEGPAKYLFLSDISGDKLYLRKQ